MEINQQQAECEICLCPRPLDSQREFNGYLVCDDCYEETQADLKRDQMKDDKLEDWD